ncbi:MAG: GTPase [Bryobacteraceae bacterium]
MPRCQTQGRKLKADLKRRLFQTHKDSQGKGGAHAFPFWVVEKEGAGQVVLIGPPNSGKSQLVSSLTHARPEVADYPFTTRVPTLGMMTFENVQIQLVDLPPLSAEFMQPWLRQVIRNAHAGVLAADLNDPAVIEVTKRTCPTLQRTMLPAKNSMARAIRCLAVSAITAQNLERFARAVFELLDLVRVYTKPPGNKADLTSLFILHWGQTVLDAARLVHKDFTEHLKFARLYHASGIHDGPMVERAHARAGRPGHPGVPHLSR